MMNYTYSKLSQEKRRRGGIGVGVVWENVLLPPNTQFVVSVLITWYIAIGDDLYSISDNLYATDDVLGPESYTDVILPV